jgi:hypothetical protein
MTATQLHRHRSHVETDAPPMADSIGVFGWLCLATIAVIAVMLVSYF